MGISRRLSRREKEEREKLGDITLQIREITAKPGVYRMFTLVEKQMDIGSAEALELTAYQKV